MRLGRMATAKGLRSFSRLRRRVGVGVLPRFMLVVWKEFPPASHHSMRCDLPAQAGEVQQVRGQADSTKNHPAIV
jgi:hypothetical protein